MQPRTVVIGATGFTGRLIASALPAARGNDAGPVVLAARDARRVARLARDTGAADHAVIDVTQPASLAGLIRRDDVVINCAGPFALLGETVVRACIGAGAHYLDTSGEQPWMRQVHRRYDDDARAARVAVVNGMAFEYALGDCAAALLARDLARPLRSLDVIYAWSGTASSRGTRRTSLRIAGTRVWQLDDGRWRRRPLAARLRTVRFASGSQRTAVLFGAGEVVTTPRWTEIDSVRGWLVMGRRNARLARLASHALPFLVPLLRPLVEPIVLRPQDPDTAARDTSTFTIRLEIRDAHGDGRALEIQGRDPYGLTATIAAYAATRLHRPGTPNGVLAPAQLLDPAPFLDSLAITRSPAPL